MAYQERGIPPQEITRRKEIDLSSRVAIVTGSSRGIGRAIAEGLGRCGANVVINSREKSRNDAQEVILRIEGFGSKAIWVPGDILEEETRTNLVKEAVNEFGRLDILVSNTGARHDGLLIRTTDEEFRQVLEINLVSAVAMARLAVTQMIKQRPSGGDVIFIGSLATEGSPGQSLYAAGKAGIEGFAKSIALEYKSRNIRINVVSPGLVETDMVKDLNPEQIQTILDLAGMKRPLKPAEITGAILGLLSNKNNGKVVKMRGI